MQIFAIILQGSNYFSTGFIFLHSIVLSNYAKKGSLETY